MGIANVIIFLMNGELCEISSVYFGRMHIAIIISDSCIYDISIFSLFSRFEIHIISILNAHLSNLTPWD